MRVYLLLVVTTIPFTSGGCALCFIPASSTGSRIDLPAPNPPRSVCSCRRICGSSIVRFSFSLGVLLLHLFLLLRNPRRPTIISPYEMNGFVQYLRQGCLTTLWLIRLLPSCTSHYGSSGVLYMSQEFLFRCRRTYASVGIFRCAIVAILSTLLLMTLVDLGQEGILIQTAAVVTVTIVTVAWIWIVVLLIPSPVILVLVGIIVHEYRRVFAVDYCTCGGILLYVWFGAVLV